MNDYDGQILILINHLAYAMQCTALLCGANLKSAHNKVKPELAVPSSFGHLPF